MPLSCNMARTAIPDYPFHTEGLNDPVSVFAGSASGNDASFSEAASSLGKALAECKVPVVYGGGKNGLMDAMAQSCLANGGYVHGVCLQWESINGLSREQSELDPSLQSRFSQEFVPSVADRKTRMAQLSGNGSIALPGAIGTLDEIVGVLTNTYLGYQKLPIIALSTEGHWDHLTNLLSQIATSGLMEDEKLGLLSVVSDDMAWAAGGWGEAAMAELTRCHDKHEAAGQSFSLDTATQESL